MMRKFWTNCTRWMNLFAVNEQVSGTVEGVSDFDINDFTCKYESDEDDHVL